ncbi:23S rRNA (adenine(1618)-N(6))-methyltransferase [Halobacteriovorax marinus]|uniref:23S rRNA (Adenine(1618)-N(6))-methyltransferase n=1 Tax=Halobacteriovorax marinus TaxID=97084 RepID=A0A1Y5FBS4_9BACT|nr:23S rRNA (adenine(1618)-N(6))-methyltransferase [Halobacteriovorax marinus]
MTKVNKKGLHPRNLHDDSYDFESLMQTEETLSPFVKENTFGNLSIDFGNPKAVLALNKALLKHFYKIENWSIPTGYLCPPIPGRVDYIHYIADLLAESNQEEIPTGKKVKGLDIGVGANCIYPLVGNSVYGWKFVGSDIDSNSINSAKSILKNNPSTKGNIKCRFQNDANKIFHDLIKPDEKFDFTICNPPFHSSLEEAQEGTARKISNLTESAKKKGINKKAKHETTLNFGGQSTELWCEGGEVKFITRMIIQSEHFKKNCLWFTTLVSKKESLEKLYKELKKVNVSELKTIEMIQGQKITRFIAWSFHSKAERETWYEK